MSGSTKAISMRMYHARKENLTAKWREEARLENKPGYVEVRERAQEMRNRNREETNAKSREKNKPARFYWEVRQEFKKKYQPWEEGGIIKVN